MLFSSVVFLFLFLPLVLLGYSVLCGGASFVAGPRVSRRLGNLWLLLTSLFFNAWGEPALTTVMIGATLVSFVGALGIARARERANERERSRAGRGWLIGVIVLLLAMLAFFKYANFGVENFNLLVDLLGKPEWRTGVLAIALPLGISFYTFQALSYVVDVYRGEVPATRSFVDFACYVTMFPQLVAGPIVRYIDVARELVERVHTREGIASGALRFCMGLAKKVLIANTVAGPADAIFALPLDMVTPAHAWLGIACYTLQIYFDFSAYSDMAIGLGRMMGFHFPENFNYPYVARSNQDFWRRWHISLSTWFRDYLYIPLGGNRGSGFATYRNLVLVFFLCGLWHGASWNFVVWGLYHGGFLVLERLFLGDVLARLPRVLQHLYLLLVTMVGWVLFRVETMAQAKLWLTAMAGGGAEVGSPLHHLDARLVVVMLAGVVLATPVVPAIAAAWQRRITSAGERAGAREAVGAMVRPVLAIVLFVWSAAVLSSGTHNPFIYFRF
jgi:alginate O-acetyltransferase complex protein AlgI